MRLQVVSVVSVSYLLGGVRCGSTVSSVVNASQDCLLKEQGMDAIGPSAQVHPYWRGTCLGEHTQGSAALVGTWPGP